MDSIKKNYERSRHRPGTRARQRPTLWTSCPLSAYWLASALFTSGCAGANLAPRDAHRLTFADLVGPDRSLAAVQLQHLPVIIHFKQGERIPLDLSLDSTLAELESPPLTLVVKRSFYMLLQADAPPRLSEDGVDFSPPSKNHFFFGFSVQRHLPTMMKAVFGIRPPPRTRS
ncbi:MAG: hypothetical protein OXU20_31225 [Myxococcales bacterium]|nr:hypothetical protein [Myxococcales bacterium]